MKEKNQAGMALAATHGASVDVFHRLMEAAALPAAVFGRQFGTWGRKYLSGPRPLGIFLPLFVLTFTAPLPGAQWILLFQFTLIWFLIVHNFRGMARRRQGYEVHSLYRGNLLFEKADGSRSGRKVALLQMGYQLALAAFFALGSVPLGIMYAVSACCDYAEEAVASSWVEWRLRGLRDAQISNTLLAQAYRERFPRNY